MATRVLPRTLYSADEVRMLDKTAIETFAIPGKTLMQRAGKAAFDVLRARWPDARRIGVFCGGGNNGGDGYVIAALAQQAGLHVCLYALSPLSALRGDAARVADDAVALGVPIQCLPQADATDTEEGLPDFSCHDVIVDAMLGTGLNAPVRGVYQQVIASIHEACRPVLAVDIPSGLSADTGTALGVALPATATVTFIGVKRGLLTAQGPVYCGDLYFDDLSVPAEVFTSVPGRVQCVSDEMIANLLPPRNVDAHKGHFGHVLVVGGDHGLGGAVIMAAAAVARVGAGLVTVATRERHCAALLSRHPEVMAHSVDTPQALAPLLEKATVVVLGPGLGQAQWGRALMHEVLNSARPLVLDADGLNNLVDSPAALRTRGNWVMTPHPGEAARMLGVEARQIQQDRFEAVTRLACDYQAVVVLKGNGTLIASPAAESLADEVKLAPVGNPGMASGGMGDVLSGVIGGLIAQGLTLEQAAAAGVFIHGKAADVCAAEGGMRGLMATDLLPAIRRQVNRG